MADETLSVKFIGDVSGLESSAAKATSAVDNVGKSFAKVSQTISQSAGQAAKNADVLGGSLAHIANRSSTARFAVQNLSNVVRDIPFGINNPAIFSTALDHVVASMTMLKQEAAAMNATTGASQTAFGLLKQSLSGGGGLLIAFNVVSVAATYLFSALMSGNSSVKSHADEIKKAKQALDEYVDSLEGVTQANLKGRQSAQDQLVTLKTLYDATQNVNIPLAERKKLVDELQEQYPKYFGNIKDEIILAGGAKNAYDKLSAAILASAKARAAQDSIVDLQKQVLTVGQQISDNAANQIKLQQQLNAEKAKGTTTTSATGEERLTAAGAKANTIQKQLNASVETGNDLLKQRNDLNTKSEQLAKFAQATIQANPEALLKPGGKVEKPKVSKEEKSAFLFEFLPFDPNGKIKPEQKGQLLDSIDKFQKEFGTIIQGAIFTGTEDQRIAQAKKLDLDIKAGNVKFDTASFKEAFNKLNKDSDIIPKDALEGLSTEVVDQFIRGFQNESDRVKGLNIFGNLTENISKDLAANVDILKTRAKQFGVQLPKVFQATNIFGKPVQVSLNDLFDTSKISNDEAIKAISNAMRGIEDAAVKDLYGFKETVSGVATDAFSSIGEGIAAALSGGDIGNAFKQFEGFLGSAVESLGKKIIELNVAALLLKKSLKLTFANPAIGIAAGIGLVAIGAALKSLAGGGVKGFAQGGLVFGPTLGLVGEGVGTSRTNPEVIAPLDKLKNFINPSSGEFPEYLPVINLSYDQLRIMYSRANKYGNTFGK